MTHVVFNAAEVDLMKQVMELEPGLSGEVILIRDDFAVGPLLGIDTEEGWQARLTWWKTLLSGSPYGAETAGQFDDRQTVATLQAELREHPDLECWIWMGQNQHDVCGYYWLMSRLGEFQGRIQVLYLNNLPFLNEKGQLFYPSWLHEIQPREFLKARKLARPITLSEFEVDPDEWKRLCEENAPVRILEGGKKISGRGVDFYDAEILRNLTREWQKATRVLTNTLHRMKIKTGDLFLMSRIRELLAAGRIESMGDTTKGWKDFDLRLPASQQETMAEPQPIH
ncbi:MAG TPA: DUF1835 domain-containing protein [Chitinophagaceae bacterium]|nr:DUF1835 domain-containing protein [Chitinophagaceae bacterium]